MPKALRHPRPGDGLDPDQGVRARSAHAARANREPDMITPFLTLVLAGFAAFMLVLGTVWARGYVDDLRKTRGRRNAPPQTAEAARHTDRMAA
jgi:hypothetical protein